MKRVIAIVGLALSLQSCIFVAGAAAGAAIVGAVYDHRKLEQISNDRDIENAVIHNINHIPNVEEKARVKVTTFNDVVLLTGEATSTDLRQQIDEAAHKVPDVSKVYNQITIQGRASSLTSASDSWITAKIKTRMLATKDLKSGSIKVVTENGVVYLMGLVTQDQAEDTVEIARNVTGVQRVMKIFQYTK